MFHNFLWVSLQVWMVSRNPVLPATFSGRRRLTGSSTWLFWWRGCIGMKQCTKNSCQNRINVHVTQWGRMDSIDTYAARLKLTPSADRVDRVESAVTSPGPRREDIDCVWQREGWDPPGLIEQGKLHINEYRLGFENRYIRYSNRTDNDYYHF